MDILQLLPRDIYDALVIANAPSSLNAFATLADITGPPIVYPLDDVINDLNTPPGGPTTGDRYIVGPAPTGAWVGNANNIAEWDGAAWIYTVVITDNTVYVTADGQTKRFNGTSWVPYPGTAVLIGGNNVGTNMVIGPRNGGFQLRLRVGTGIVARFGSSNTVFAHQLFIGTSNVGSQNLNPSATLEVTKRISGSINGGFLMPRLTEAERNAFVVSATSPATGLLYYQTDNTPGFYYNSGTPAAPVWTRLSSGTEDLAATLVAGNITGGTNIAMSSGDSIQAVSGGGYLNLREGVDNKIFLVNDGGGFTKEGLWIENDYASIFTSGFASVVEIDDTIGGGNNVLSIIGSNNIELKATSGFQAFFTGGGERMRVLANGQVSIGTATPNASAKLEVTSTTQGFLLTAMTSAQASAITPVNGLFVTVSDTDATFTAIGTWCYQNGVWTQI